MEKPPDPVSNPPENVQSPGSDRVPLLIWMRRAAALLFVCACAISGVVLLILPWRAEWTDNYLFFRYPLLRTIMAGGFFRGLCSGLGVLDIWVGFWEATHYHDGRKPPA